MIAISINTTWTDPSTGGTIDLNTGGTVTETIWDAILSNVKRLGGTDGDTKTGDMKFGANKVHINDDTNTNLTVGLTINQGANDDQIVAFKSSDVAHGMTTSAETDTYGHASKLIGSSGGLRIDGLTGDTLSLALFGSHVNDATAKTTGASGSIVLAAFKKSGTTVGDCGTDANLLLVRNNNTVRFIFDAEGSGHADVEWVAYAQHDDLALISDIEAELLRREDIDQTARRHHLESVGIIGPDSWHFEAGRPRAMVNFTKLAMLHHGALMQVGSRLVAGDNDRALLWQAITELAERNLALESKMTMLGVN